MNNLQKDFITRSISALENIAERAGKESNLPSEFVREAFRTLHTIKGTAQTFGFKVSANIAHELENSLSAEEISKENLLENLQHLIDSFTKKEKFNLKTNSSKEIAPNFIKFDDEFLNQFAEHEKKQILFHAHKGKRLFLLNANFELKNFSEEFKDLREKISEQGEIIASLPNPNAAGKIGFRICFAARENQYLEDFPNEIIEQKPLAQNNLDEILNQITAHAKELANRLEKQVEIKISTAKLELSRENSKLVFDILIHLVRNAIDHALERKGEIEISVNKSKNHLKLSVKDNGKGIDFEKIKTRAIEKKLISPDKILTETEMLDLIFLYDFSTAEALTEISGRGVGLNAVKKIAENAGGGINVKSIRNVGTAFEVFLRYEK